MKAPAVFSFGLVSFGFLGMGPVTIAVDSYGPDRQRPVRLRAGRSSRASPASRGRIKKDYGFDLNFSRAKHLLRRTTRGKHFKATAKPVLDRNRRGRRHHHDFF